MKSKVRYFWLAVLCSLASMSCIREDYYKYMHGCSIEMGDITIMYREGVTSKPIAIVGVGVMDGKCYWWYSGTKFVLEGVAQIGKYSLAQLDDGGSFYGMKTILTAYLYYEHGQFFYSEHANKRSKCLFFDPGVAALDLKKGRFFLYAFAFIVFFPFFRIGEKSIAAMARRYRPRNDKIRKTLVMIIVLMISLPASVAIISILKGAKIFLALFFHWLILCPDGHGRPGFEMYNLFLVPVGFAVLFTIYDPGWFYNKLVDVFVPALAFGSMGMLFSAGLIMILCDAPVMPIIILGSLIALGLSLYFWTVEGI